MQETNEIRDKVVLVGLNSPVLNKEGNADESTMTVPFDFIICYAHLGVTWKPFPWSGILIRHKKFDLCVESQCR